MEFLLQEGLYHLRRWDAIKLSPSSLINRRLIVILHNNPEPEDNSEKNPQRLQIISEKIQLQKIIQDSKSGFL